MESCRLMQCTVLHCTALHCTELNCTALHSTAQHCTALHCTCSCTCSCIHGFLVAIYGFLEWGPRICSCSCRICSRSRTDFLQLYCQWIYSLFQHCTSLHCTALHCRSAGIFNWQLALNLQEDEYIRWIRA